MPGGLINCWHVVVPDAVLRLQSRMCMPGVILILLHFCCAAPRRSANNKYFWILETGRIKDQIMTQREPQIPQSIKLSDIEGGMLITYRWYKAKYLLALMLAPACAYFLVRSDYVAGDFQAFTVPSVLIVMAALLIVYYSLARVLNTTRIRVLQDRILVCSGPLPFGGNRKLYKDDVVQLYVTRQAVGHRYYLTVTTYQVNVQLVNGSVMTLVRGLASAEQGWFIEKNIESFFMIQDIPVRGEVDKS
jgi:hypothetical protein